MLHRIARVAVVLALVVLGVLGLLAFRTADATHSVGTFPLVTGLDRLSLKSAVRAATASKEAMAGEEGPGVAVRVDATHLEYGRTGDRQYTLGLYRGGVREATLLVRTDGDGNPVDYETVVLPLATYLATNR